MTMHPPYIHTCIHTQIQTKIHKKHISDQGKNIDIKIQKLIPNLKHKYIKTCISIYIYIHMHKEIHTEKEGERGIGL